MFEVTKRDTRTHTMFEVTERDTRTLNAGIETHAYAGIETHAHTQARYIYTKYELAYPCGNDANTGRCCRYNSILPLEEKNVWRHPPGTKGASGCRT